MEHGLKDIAFYVQWTYNTLHSCHNFPAGSRQAARGARICEMSLLALGKLDTILKLQFSISFYWLVSQMNAKGPHWW